MPQQLYKDLFQPISITSTKEMKEATSPKAHASMLITMMTTSRNLVVMMMMMMMMTMMIRPKVPITALTK